MRRWSALTLRTHIDTLTLPQRAALVLMALSLPLIAVSVSPTASGEAQRLFEETRMQSDVERPTTWVSFDTDPRPAEVGGRIAQ